MRKSISASKRNEMLKGICPCCGKNEKEVIHHILPLALGGIDEDSNLIGICSECHGKIHGGTDTHNLAKVIRFSSGKLGGRPKDYDYEKAFDLLDKFAMYQITKEYLCEQMNINPSDLLTKFYWFRQWKKDRCIPNGARVGTSQLFNRGNGFGRMKNGQPMIIENGKFVTFARVDKTMIEALNLVC